MIQFDKYFLNGFEAPTSLQPLRLTLRSEIRPLDMFNQKQLTSAIDGVNYAPRKLTWIPKMMLWKQVSPFEVWCPQRLCCHSNPAAILRNPDTWSSFQLAAALWPSTMFGHLFSQSSWLLHWPPHGLARVVRHPCGAAGTAAAGTAPRVTKGASWATVDCLCSSVDEIRSNCSDIFSRFCRSF